MRWLRAGLLIVLVMVGTGGATVAQATVVQAAGQSAANPGGYFVYWDQNEEEDVQAVPSGQLGQLVAPWDANGQMCILPDGSGRFVTGYNPTSAGNPGSQNPTMQPPVGEALWGPSGAFTGETVYVPGPYLLAGQTVGGDIPPDTGGTFNSNGTFVGCAFDLAGDLLATDLGTAQGQFPPPDDGRLIEWFAPAYSTYCIVDGPTTGGVGPHHVDGTGGLTQPGDIAVSSEGDVLVPEAGPADALLSGRVVRYRHGSLPRSAADCGPSGLYPPSRLRRSVFIQGSPSLLPFPQSIAYDKRCRCWAVASTFGDPGIAWFDHKGRPLPRMGVVPGESLLQIGLDPNGYNPFGLTFAPGGVLYFVDIHIQCSAPLTNCGPETNGGRIMKVTFTNGRPDPPVPIAAGYNFPTSVTVCVVGPAVCPRPTAFGP